MSRQEAAADRLPELRRMADAVRRVVEATVVTTVPDAELDRAAALVTQAAEVLEGAQRDVTLDHDMRRASRPHELFPYDPTMGYANPLAPPVEVAVEDGTVVGTVTFGTPYQGPPGLVHGAAVAGVFDQLLGIANMTGGNPGMTGTLTVRYRRPTPLHVALRFEVRFDRVEGRKTFTAGRCLDAEGNVLSEAEGVFVGFGS